MEQAVAALPGLAAPLASQLGTYLRTNRTRLRYDLFRQPGCSAAAAPSRPPIGPCYRSGSNEADSAGPMAGSTASCAYAPP